MVIEILAQKYKTGCGRGMAIIEYPSLLVKLNLIIEWDLCTFPMKRKEAETDPDIEDREFLGTDPELKPGDCFMVSGGQVIAVESPEKLVLVVSETGHGALQRIWDESIAPELEMYFSGSGVEIEHEVASEVPSEFSESYRPGYHKYKIWKSKYITGRGYLEKGLCIKVEMTSDLFVFPVVLYMLDWEVRYNPEDIDETEIEVAVDNVLAWFYNNYPRIAPPKVTTPEEGCDCNEVCQIP